MGMEKIRKLRIVNDRCVSPRPFCRVYPRIKTNEVPEKYFELFVKDECFIFSSCPLPSSPLRPPPSRGTLQTVHFAITLFVSTKSYERHLVAFRGCFFPLGEGKAKGESGERRDLLSCFRPSLEHPPRKAHVLIPTFAPSLFAGQSHDPRDARARACCTGFSGTRG